jgi:hypothetical protein
MHLCVMVIMVAWVGDADLVCTCGGLDPWSHRSQNSQLMLTMQNNLKSVKLIAPNALHSMRVIFSICFVNMAIRS